MAPNFSRYEESTVRDLNKLTCAGVAQTSVRGKEKLSASWLIQVASYRQTLRIT